MARDLEEVESGQEAALAIGNQTADKTRVGKREAHIYGAEECEKHGEGGERVRYTTGINPDYLGQTVTAGKEGATGKSNLHPSVTCGAGGGLPFVRS